MDYHPTLTPPHNFDLNSCDHFVSQTFKLEHFSTELNSSGWNESHLAPPMDHHIFDLIYRTLKREGIT